MEESKDRRLFVAVDLPPLLLDKIPILQKGLEGTGAKIVNKENLHMTLCFIGETPQKEAKSFLDELSKIKFKKINLQVKGVSAFPNDYKPQVIFLNILENDSLNNLSSEICLNFDKKQESKKFKSHLTIARFRGGPGKVKVKSFIQKNKKVDIGHFLMDKICLYSSTLKQEGPVYKKLGEVCAIDCL